MKNKLFISFIIALQATSISAMDGCDHTGLETTAQRYTLCIKNSKEINPEGIGKDLHFLSPEAIKSTDFAKYAKENSFELIARYAITAHQQRAIKIFAQEFESVKTNDLKRTQLCMLLDKIIINLRPSINIDLSTNPVLQSLANSPSYKFPKMLLPYFLDESQ